MKCKFLQLFLLMVFGCQLAIAQVMNVTGHVVDSKGEAIIGASVLVKGTAKGSATDIDGAFHLSGVNQKDIIQVSYVGMKSVELPAKSQMNIVLETLSTSLDDVIVVAFGEQKKSSFTGSAAVVNSDKIQARQVTNAIEALDGQVAGLQMVKSSGNPDATPTLRIRGYSSINAGKDPLIIVDGVPYDGGWNNLNPADIENITVLKDAASNALYGSRGANGVVMITTKRAKVGDAMVSLDARWGSNAKAALEYDNVLDPGQYYELHYAALNNYYRSSGMNSYDAHVKANNTLAANASQGGLGYMAFAIPSGEYLIGDNGRLNPNATLGNRVYNNGKVYTVLPDNWVDAAYHNSLRQEYNLNVNGGNDKMQFYASLGYLNNDGIAYGSDYERFSARIKASYQVKKWMKIGGNVNYTRATTNGAYIDSSSSNSSFYMINTMAPIYPLYLRDGDGNILSDAHGLMYDYGDGAENGLIRPVLSKQNQLKDDQLDTDRSENNSYFISGFTDITPIDGLKITLNGNMTEWESRNTSTVNPYYGGNAQTYPNGYVYKGVGRTSSYNLQQLVNYNRKFDKHNMTLLLGHENYKRTNDVVWGSRTGMFSYADNQELSGAISVLGNNSNKFTYNTEGYFFRGQYDYDGKYFGSVSYRRDASSRFHPDHRWGNFYSMGGAWIISNEPWFKVNNLNMLKLKASFGEQGNDDINLSGYDYPYYTNFYNIVNSNNNIALTFNNAGNENITWETNDNFNCGVEFEALNSRITGSIEYFYRNTRNMLCWVGVPLSMGYAGYYSNIGNMSNKGVELDINATIVSTKDFNWNVNFNLTHYKNTITNLSADNRGADLEGHEGYVNGFYFYGVDLPIYTWRLKRYAGPAADGRSQWYITDGDGNTTTTTSWSSASYYDCGSANPDLYGGFGTSLSFRGIDFSTSFGYSIGGKIYDNQYASLMSVPSVGYTGSAIHKDMLKAWTESNTDTDVPRLQFNDTDASSASDRFLTDASYISLQSINLGYTLPAKFTKRFGLSKVRIYGNAENVYYWGKRKGLDARTTFNGNTSAAQYSPVRTISGGLNVQF